MESNKQVLRISINGQFSQYLKKSEVRFINDIATHGKVTVELVFIDKIKYKALFGY